MRIKNHKTLGWKSALAIGLAQALALIPGTSRSGITMTMARALSFDRPTATKFSMLLSIPTIVGAAVLEGIKYHDQLKQLLQSQYLSAIFVSFIVAYSSIAFLMNWSRKSGYGIFVIYRLLFGALCLGMYYYPAFFTLVS